MAWRVARALNVLLDQYNRAYPGRSKASDGSIGDADHANRNSDHNPWYGPGIVTARDFTHDPAAGMDINRLTDELAASRDNRIKYIIANGLILDSRPGNHPWQWRRYNGPNPHTKHFHVSVMPNATCDDPRPWRVAGHHGGPPGGGFLMALNDAEQQEVLVAARQWSRPWASAEGSKWAAEALMTIYGQERAVYDYRNHHMAPDDNQYGHGLSTRKRLDDLEVKLDAIIAKLGGPEDEPPLV